MKNGS